MSILTWIEDKKRLKVLNAPKHSIGSTDSSKGLWTRCDKCGVILYIKHLKENQRVCFSCSYHLQMMSGERIENLLDKSSANALPFSKENNQRSKSGISPSLLSQSESGNQSFLKKKGHFSQQKQDTNVRERYAPGKSDSLEPFFVSSAKAKKKGNATYFSTWRPLDETVSPCDPLKFHDQKAYTDRLQDAQERTGLQDAIQTGTGMIDGIPVALAVMDFSFMGGSMGSVVGEKITRLIEYATGEGLTLLIVSASGGARMQEGVFSLMQMAKISSALQIYQSCAKLLYISILTSPTTGGVTASFAMLGDIIFAEPKALIAFAGRRVIEQTLCEDLPDDFQTSEYMLHHGLVDLIVPRRFLRQALSETIRLYQNAPFKKRGQIPFGVQNPITFLTEEKIRRSWGSLTSPSTKAMSYPENNYSYNQNKIVSQQELERRSLTKTSKKSSEKSELFKAKLGSLEPGFSSFCDANKAITNRKFVRGHTNLREPTKLRFEGQASARKSSPTFFYNENEISAKATRAFKEPAFSNQGTNFPLRVTKQSFVTPGFSNPKQIYREILTSFEIMLALFISGNSKKQNQASLRLQKTTYNKSSRDFLSGKIKAPFWVYNNLVLRAPNTFDDSNKAFIFAEQREAHQKQIILGQYRKNQPLYSLLRNNFADYRNLKQGFSREDGRLSPKSLSTSFKPKRTFQKPTFLSKFCDAKLPLATTRDKKGLQSKAKEPGFSWFCDAGAKGSSTFASDPYTNRRFDASEAGTRKKGKQDTFFLQGVTKQSFVTPGFSNQSSNGPGFSNLKGEVFLQKSGLRRIQGEASPHVGNSRKGKGTYEPWSFSKQLRGAFLNQSFFNFSRKNCKVLLSKTFLTSTKLTSAQRSQQKSSFPTSNLYAKSHKSSIKRQAKPNLRLKWSFVQQVIFDYGFYSSFVTKRLQNVDKKHTFAQEQAKKEALRDPYFNEGQIKKYDFVKDTTSRSLEKKREQNRADTNKDTPSSSLLSNFRNLAQATLEANRLQTSDLQRSLGEIPAEPRQTFYDKQNTVTGLAGTVLNRSAIGIQHTDYLRLRALSFLQNNAKANNGFEEKESPIANANGVSNELDFTTQKSNLLGKKKGLTNQNESPYTSKKGLVTDFTSAEADLDFLNQAIELAATESVEWRAFYIDQQLSENMGFLDDFLHARSGSEGTSGNRTQDQSSIGTYLKSMFHPSQSSDSHNQFGNVLYYKSLCRSKNLFSI